MSLVVVPEARAPDGKVRLTLQPAVGAVPPQLLGSLQLTLWFSKSSRPFHVNEPHDAAEAGSAGSINSTLESPRLRHAASKAALVTARRLSRRLAPIPFTPHLTISLIPSAGRKRIRRHFRAECAGMPSKDLDTLQPAVGRQSAVRTGVRGSSGSRQEPMAALWPDELAEKEAALTGLGEAAHKHTDGALTGAISGADRAADLGTALLE
jgi:hypothetical protein